jgi:hypothetical protein
LQCLSTLEKLITSILGSKFSIDDLSNSKCEFSQVSPLIMYYYQNVRGLCTKACEFLLSSVSMPQYDIIALTETWLNDNIDDAELFDLNKYNVFRKDRNFTCTKLKRGGSVLLAVNHNTTATLIKMITRSMRASPILYLLLTY